jgi:hypothetical protein
MFQASERDRMRKQQYSGEVNNAQIIADLRHNISTLTTQREALVCIAYIA